MARLKMIVPMIGGSYKNCYIVVDGTKHMINGIKNVSMGFDEHNKWEVVIKLSPIEVEFLEEEETKC